MVQGRVFAASPVPVLRHAVSAGEVIRKDDLEIVYRRDDQLAPDTVTDPKRLVGTSPRSRLRLGEPIRSSDTRLPILVTRNSQIIIKLDAGAMQLTAQGRAIDEGAKGDVIRVLNLQSNKTIEATVAGPDLATVNLGPRLANAN
jgi:flagella basal body P-ring formation protein FlgA